jgi:hypothetical protein
MEQDLVLLKKLRGALIMNHPKVAMAIVNVLIADIAADDGVITDEERALINAAPEAAEPANSGETPTDNTCVMPFPTFIELCESVEKSHIGTLSDRERLVVNRVRDIIGRQQHNT